MAGKSKQRKQTDKALVRRLAPPLAFLLALCLLVICCYDAGYSALPPTEKRYAAAKADIASLKLDDKKGNLREPWEKLATEFRAIYDTDPAWPNRPAALFRAAESLEELAKRSFAKADARKAIECYESLALRHADSRLADDALFRAARMRAAWLKDDKGALALLARIKSQYPKGDMLSEALALEKALKASVSGRTAPEARQVAAADRKEAVEDQPAAPEKSSSSQAVPPSVSEDRLLPRYRAAKARMEALRADKIKSCWRQPWEELQTEFQRIYESRKDWAVAPGALFRSAASQEALADCSHLPSDYRRALELYLALTREFPKSALADDALLCAARIQSTRLGKTSEGLALLDEIAANYPRGDMAAEARSLRAQWRGTLADAGGADSASRAAERHETPEVQVLSWDSLNKNSVEIVLEMSGPTRYSTRLVKARKGAPARLYLDLENAAVVSDVRKGVTVRGSLLQAVRVRDRKEGGASLQFDFREVRRFDARIEDDPCRIVLSVAAGKTPLPRKAGAAAAFAAGDEDTPAPRASKTGIRSRQVSDMASQLGLTVHTVFIDAGHGGRDPGTSHNKVLERLVTLDVAMTLGRLLEANGLEVVYSRTRDTAVSLSERTRRANAARADLFVSVHVNASEDPRVSGVETYYLDLASNPQAARVAALENAGSDRRLGDMQNMLADVMLNARVEESRRLAGDIQRLSMFRLKRREFTVRNNGVKAAPFHVLLGAQMPAVLVELGYCTNPAEARNLADPKYRHALAEGLAEGILAYKDRLLKRQTAQNSLTPNGPGAM
ncbi:MAG: N-acetylmuramoyl-L-alanine amidase [Desulfovibrio sp.]|uniref:N-acetylmuramoyl-L-alanine amidase n=1 Tax=Desulfovibrio sp. TaxID=885 RepID=UPI0025C5AE12|nr:N-acetylmuramoyl-L-alanine amidase [Desulfovibrio sp.]MBS6831188.1 N-acetylmuramoyl-L-alanine amidase [Desulfovibrio sp.]